MEAAQEKNLDCLTTNILCRDGSLTDHLFYAVNDFFQYLSYLHRPFSTGMFMMFSVQEFHELGGFDERVHFAEDYRLSCRVARRNVRVRARVPLPTQRGNAELLGARCVRACLN